MRVNNVSVRYSRTRQPAKYEEAGGLVEFSAVLEENVEADADYKAVATRLFGEAKTIVLTELALIPAGANASAHAVTAAAGSLTPAPVVPAAAGEQRRAGDKPETPAAKKKREATEAAALAAAEQTKNSPPATAAGLGDIPADDVPPAKSAETALGRTLPAAKVEPAGPGDIPVDDTPAATTTVPVTAATPQQVAAAAAPGVTTAVDVQKYITSCLVAKKFLPNVILGKLKNDYKVDRVYDLKPDDLAKFHAQVKALAGEG